jgi:hypothetical protein
MYDALEAVRDELKSLQALLAANDAASRVRRIAGAFEQAIQHISDRTRECADEAHRARLQTLYRGLLAGRRLVERLHELPNPGEAAAL